MYRALLIATLLCFLAAGPGLPAISLFADENAENQLGDDDDDGIRMDLAPYEFEQRGEILAIADRHGDLDALWSILAAEKVYERIIGAERAGFLDIVFLGDYVDRGENSRAVLDSVIGLKLLAHSSSNVRVHTLNGNHEWLLARGDNAYMSLKDKANFTDLRMPFEEEIRKIITSPAYPYREFLQSNLARVKIGDHVFQHAGLEPEYVNAPGPILNYLASEHMGEWLNWFAEERFEEHPVPYVSTILDPAGPFHSRRLVAPSSRPALSQAEVEEMLATLKAKRFYMGHHILDTKIQSHYQGRIFTLDTGPAHLANGMTSAAVINRQGELEPRYIKVQPAASLASRRKFLENSTTQLPPSLRACIMSYVGQASNQ